MYRKEIVNEYLEVDPLAAELALPLSTVRRSRFSVATFFNDSPRKRKSAVHVSVCFNISSLSLSEIPDIADC